ncbi:MAG: histidine phosphatase family protein [Rhodobacteraceae bacterium]|nr:histidine phosphatase family protein [Paracoccaceae bacterium]
MTVPELYIIRHGETEWNRAGRWQGDLDSPLTENGQTQAVAMGGLLRSLNITPDSHAFWTSPIGRARKTAALVLDGQGEALEDARLREISVGDWTGASREEVRATSTLHKNANFLDFYAATPGGESFASMQARTEAVIAGLTGPTVLITHGITSRFLRLAALGWGEERLGELPGGQGVIFRIHEGCHEELVP